MMDAYFALHGTTPRLGVKVWVEKNSACRTHGDQVEDSRAVQVKDCDPPPKPHGIGGDNGRMTSVR